MELPKETTTIIETLQKNNFEGFLVGGCVRDMLRKKIPADFDIATNANPEQVKAIFKKSFSDNDLGTVTVFTGSKKDNLKEVQITTYRTEEQYKDKVRKGELLIHSFSYGYLFYLVISM
ncbi:MAG: hypothetical protein EOM23_07810 [Candidatus Moranbacteria bacterium]|nr:hypothetical protein [Candidatus Moranbacteria bacterium]